MRPLSERERTARGLALLDAERRSGDRGSRKLMNYQHIPAGSPQGGEFAPKGGGEAGGGGAGTRGRSRGAAGGAKKSGGSARNGGTARSGGSGGSKGEGEGGGASKTAKALKESVHERAARLQQEQGLPQEVRPGAELQVVGSVDRVPNPALAPDARFLTQLYGEHQLGAALSRYSAPELKLTAAKEGVKAAASKADTISRITAHVTQGRYSANFPKASGGDRVAAGHTRHQAKIAKLEGQLASAKADYEAFKAKHGAAVTASERDVWERRIALIEHMLEEEQAMRQIRAVERGLALLEHSPRRRRLVASPR